MGLESYKQLNIDFINKLINNKHNNTNLEDLGEDREGGKNELENEEDLTKLESKVDIYLSKIKELDSFFSENEEERLNNNINNNSNNNNSNKYERINGKIREFVNVEKEHQSGPYNRHIYFAGIPLKSSLEVLGNLRTIKSQREQIGRLTEEVKRAKEELKELNEEKKLNFERFEDSIQKALKLGLGLRILTDSVHNFDLRRLRLFFSRLRFLNYSQLRSQVDKLSSFKVLSLVHALNNLVKSRLYSSFYSLKLNSNRLSYDNSVLNNTRTSTNLNNNFKINGKLNKELLDNKPFENLTSIDSNNKLTRESNMEQNLLNRLEKLLIEEINILNQYLTLYLIK